MRRRPPDVRRRRSPQPGAGARPARGRSRARQPGRAAVPDGHRLRRSRGWRRSASARSPSRSARSPPRPSCATSSRRADVDVLLGVPEYRGNDYVAALEEAVGLRAHGPRPAAAPFLRDVWLDAGFAALEARADEVTDALLDAIEDDVTPDDRMVIVHTSGSTSAPKGVIHQHGPLLGHLATLNDLRGLATGTRLFSNSPMFWVGGLALQRRRRARRGRDAAVLGRRRSRRTPSTSSSASGPSSPTGSSASIAALVAHPTFATRDFSSIRSGNLYPLLPDGGSSGRPRAASQHARHDRDRQRVPDELRRDATSPSSRRGSFGRPVPGLDARVVDHETLADVPIGRGRRALVPRARR